VNTADPLNVTDVPPVPTFAIVPTVKCGDETVETDEVVDVDDQVAVLVDEPDASIIWMTITSFAA
jgi:hypothetical protein